MRSRLVVALRPSERAAPRVGAALEPRRSPGDGFRQTGRTFAAQANAGGEAQAAAGAAARAEYRLQCIEVKHNEILVKNTI